MKSKKQNVFQRKKNAMFWYITLFFMISILTVITGCLNGQNASLAEDSSIEQSRNDYNRKDILADTAGMLLENAPDPSYGSVCGEWLVFGLSRWEGEVPDAWFNSYYHSLEAYLQECEGVLDERKYTEYSRVILALTAMGKNPEDVSGYNILTPLADYEQTIFQGINGPAYALLALDSGNYDIPEVTTVQTQATRELYLKYLLENELEGGGWSLAGSEPEADITAMILQALAKYQDRLEVADAVSRGVEILAKLQNDHGGYTSYDSESSETISQVIVALCELGISVEDERFVKQGHTLEDCLMDYRTQDGGFMHVLGGDSNLIAAEQAFYSLVALERAETGMSSLYRIS